MACICGVVSIFKVHVDVDVNGGRDEHVAPQRYGSQVTHSNASFLCTHSSVYIRCVGLHDDALSCTMLSRNGMNKSR